MDKREKLAKKIIRKKFDTPIFYYFDLIFRIYFIKVIKIEDLDEPRQLVRYKKGLNLWNPFTWLIIIFFTFANVAIESYKAAVEILGDLKPYTSHTRINFEEENKQ